ncbi:hypothetical protein JCM10296v2_002784 [Rhodotorula toruloides]
MMDTITLLTADDPPKPLTHSRAILAAHSTVFRDLFSLPTSETDQAESSGSASTVSVAETEAEIVPFLSIHAGELGGEFALLDRQWIDVALLADKYDRLVARVFVENMISAPLAYWRLWTEIGPNYHGMCGDNRCNLDAVERIWFSAMRRLAEIDPSRAQLDAPFFPMIVEGPWSPQDFGICLEHVQDSVNTVRWVEENQYRKKAPSFPD